VALICSMEGRVCRTAKRASSMNRISSEYERSILVLVGVGLFVGYVKVMYRFILQCGELKKGDHLSLTDIVTLERHHVKGCDRRRSSTE
jgi:hypothetical protein